MLFNEFCLIKVELCVKVRHDMNIDDNLGFLVKYLTYGDVQERVSMLRVLKHDPLVDKQIYPHLEQLLLDTTPTIVSIPFSYSEVRWLAAHALASLRVADHATDIRQIAGLITPLDSGKLGVIRRAAGISRTLSWQDAFVQLRAAQHLPLCTIELTPHDPHGLVYHWLPAPQPLDVP